MKKVVIASENPVKIEVAKQAFLSCFPNENFEYISVKSQSGIPDQPMGDEQTILGVKNRIEFIKSKYPEADYFVGQEGGLIDTGKEMHETAFVGIEDKNGFFALGKTASFLIPFKIAEFVRQGDELGTANDKVTGLVNSKQAGGVISTITDGIIDRTKLYFQAAAIALSQVKHKEWYLN